MAINFALEFMWQKFVVFRKPKDKKGKAEQKGETENDEKQDEHTQE